MGFTHAMSQFATRCQEKTRNHEHGANAKALGRKFDAILTHAVAQLATSNSRISKSAQNLNMVWLPSGVLRGICGCWSAFRLRNSTCPKSVDLALRTRKSMDPGTWHNRTLGTLIFGFSASNYMGSRSSRPNPCREDPFRGQSKVPPKAG